MRDELWINEVSKANPLQAAIASWVSFTAGGILPFLVVLFLPIASMEYSLYIASILFLALLWALSAKAGWANMKKAIARITFWGTVAMGLTALVGYVFWVSLG
jgi:VIT1/CCC1 family predicted Fe2+/Mn2+ transporter